MSLVDYASSSGEEEDEDKQDKLTQPIAASSEIDAGGNERQEEEDAKTEIASPSRPPSVVSREDQNRVRLASNAGGSESPSIRPAIQLPDASALFASPSFSGQSAVGTDHASRVAAAINANTSRKRDSNGFAQFSRSNHPRRNFSHSRNEPNIPGNLLPPQLRGRSNVVTEDISKLFVNRRAP